MHRYLLPLLFVFATSALPQTSADDQTALERARADLTGLADDPSEQAANWRDAYEERIRILEELIQTAADLEALPSVDELEQRSLELDGLLEATKREADAEPILALASTDELDRFEREADAEEARRVTARAALDSTNKKRSAAQEELDNLSERGAKVRSRGDSHSGNDELSRYRSDSAILESRVVSERNTFLNEALDRWKQYETNLRKELELAELKAAQASRMAELARDGAAKLREEEARQARQKAEDEARLAEQEQDPIERLRLRARSEAGHLRAEIKDFETELVELADRQKLEREALRTVEADKEALQERVDLQPRGVEKLLRQHLDRGRRARRLLSERTLPELDEGLEETQVALADVLDRLWTVSLPTSENEELAQVLRDVGQARWLEAAAAFELSLEEDGLLEALTERSEQLKRATTLYTDIFNRVYERRAQLEDLEEFILARMLWSRSDRPIDTRALAQAWRELVALPQPYQQDKMWSRLWKSFGTRIPLLLIAVGAVVFLRWLRRRLDGWRNLAESSAAWRRFAIRFVTGISWAIMPALELWIIAWAIRRIAPPAAFAPPVPTFLLFQGYFVAARRIVRILIGPGGLLIGPHAFPAAVGLQLSRTARTITLAGQILFVPFLVLSGEPFEQEVVPRFFSTAWALVLTVTLLGLVRRNGALVQSWTGEGGLLRPILRFLAIFSAVTLVPIFALDVLGYRVGAHRTLINGLKIFTALFILGAVFRLVERIGSYWVDRAAKAQTEEDERLMRARGLGVRAIVRVGAYMIVLISALLLKETMGIGGALSKLLVEIQVVELREGEWLTGWDVATAILWVVAGHIIASNLRMLHESLVAPFAGTTDEGSQYAFMAILRYAVLAIAYSAALLAMGFSFETLGWFATAASVGLGFGLQEIVANFVSGLILLFERPIRVGDIVTIGTTSGKIDSISMRATVITNWDRQTIIVPNKKFVTEDLTNWTRADRVMRRNLTVRVAYGTDVEGVLRLLNEIVASHHAVLKDPAPRIFFESFGVVGIEFQVLFYTSIDEGLSTRSEIHAMISSRFVKEGIEIPSVKLPEEYPGQGGHH